MSMCCVYSLFPLPRMAQIKSDRGKQVSHKSTNNHKQIKPEKSSPTFISVRLWILCKPDGCVRPLNNILYNSANRMFSSAFLEQKTIQTQDNMLPFCSPDSFIIQNPWPSNRLHRDVWIAGNICLHNGPMPGSKAGKGLIFLPSVCLSMIRIIRVALGGNATNVKQYIPSISAVLVDNGALCWAGSPSSEGNAP